ncbi:MAG: ABC transporter permease [Muribaculaceae bacterium]|nr:ABC transporter permease [Muribaculaceae bacterium]
MNAELFIAQRLKLDANGDPTTPQQASPSLSVALAGIVLAIVVMILSVAVVIGFKDEITHKVYGLDAHIKVSNAALGVDDNYLTVRGLPIKEALNGDSALLSRIASMSVIADQPAILKTDSDFEGIIYRGVDAGYDWSFLDSHLVDGRLPSFENSAPISEVVISRSVADKLHLHAGDHILTYFIEDKIKVRNSHIVGIVNTDFDNFDNEIMLGNIAQIQSVNGWKSDEGHYVGINLKDASHASADAYHLYSTLARHTCLFQGNTLHAVSNTTQNNAAFFAWLDMLNMNVAVILVLMIIVSGFTLIAALLMVVLERIRMIGLLKSMGATNSSIRRIFIFLTGKLMLRALLWGNVIGVGLALVQRHFHIIHLDPSAYYMPYVPISLSVSALIALNVGILVISYVTLLGPSYIISTIQPTTTMRFE